MQDQQQQQTINEFFEFDREKTDQKYMRSLVFTHSHTHTVMPFMYSSYL